MFVAPLFFCKKQVDYASVVVHDHLPSLSLNVSSSNIALYQANANQNAIRFDWGYQGANVTDAVYYVLQFSLKQDQFDFPVELPVGNSVSIALAVEQLNELMLRMIEPGDAEDIAVRVKYMRQVSFNQKVVNNEEIFYSDQILLKLSTYRPIITYNSPNFLTLPGNYQSWDPLLAPKIVSQPGMQEFEGYVYMPIEYPQFLFVSGNLWSDFVFGHIGPNMFGVKGTSLSIFGGKGTYLIRASRNTNRWSYAKIYSWGLNGSAVPSNGEQDPELTQDPTNKCMWTLNINLAEGDLFFRANNNNDIKMGNLWPGTDHIPDYNGDPIHIDKPGNYTIELDLSFPGNYMFHVHRNFK